MKDLIIASLFNGATDAEGHVIALGTLTQMAARLDAASREISDMQPSADPEAILRIEAARVALLAITQQSKQLSRLLLRAVLR